MAILNDFDVCIGYCNTDLLDRDAISAADLHLSINEKDRRDRFRFQTDQRDFTVAHGLLRQTLSIYSDLPPSDWKFSIDAHGKPSIDSNDPKLSELSFSLSHTQGFVACAVTTKAPVGIDVERIDQSLLAQEIAERYFSKEEVQQLRDCPNDLRGGRITEMWTLKEAFLKAVGVGHFGSPTDISFRLNEHRNIGFSASTTTGIQSWQFALFEPLADVRMSIAVAVPSPPRYFFHPYNGRVLDSFLATPSKQSVARPNRGLPL